MPTRHTHIVHLHFSIESPSLPRIAVRRGAKAGQIGTWSWCEFEQLTRQSFFTIECVNLLTASDICLKSFGQQKNAKIGQGCRITWYFLVFFQPVGPGDFLKCLGFDGIMAGLSNAVPVDVFRKAWRAQDKIYSCELQAPFNPCNRWLKEQRLGHVLAKLSSSGPTYTVSVCKCV